VALPDLGQPKQSQIKSELEWQSLIHRSKTGPPSRQIDENKFGGRFFKSNKLVIKACLPVGPVLVDK
jgi:hypothetical protein